MSDIKLVCWNANVNTIFLLRSGCYHIYGEMFFIIHGELKLEWFLLLPFFFPPLNRMGIQFGNCLGWENAIHPATHFPLIYCRH